MERQSKGAGDEGRRERVLTVAQVRERPGYAEVMFHESARIYRLSRSNPKYKSALQELRGAAAERKPVRVRFVEPNGAAIESVSRPQ